MVEVDLRQQLEGLKNEKKSLAKELEDLKRSIAQYEKDKANHDRLQDQWKRELLALRKKVELVSDDSIGEANNLS